MENHGAAVQPRPVRSFVRREGRITKGQRQALDALLPRYGLNPGEPLEAARVFGRVAPLTLEIGFGNGESLLHQARARGDEDFIGIEVHRPGVGRLLMTVEREGLHNVRVYCADAVEVLRRSVPENALTTLQTYFPDPWPKKRHHKRRLIQPEFVALAAARLRPGGRWLLATDWQPYAEHMLEVLGVCPRLRNLAADGRYIPRPPERMHTRFEARGEHRGHRVFDLAFHRTGD